MEEIFYLMEIHRLKKGVRLKLEMFADGSGGFEDQSSGITMGMFDNVTEVKNTLKTMCE